MMVSAFCARVNHTVTPIDERYSGLAKQVAEIVEPDELDAAAERIGEHEGLRQRAQRRDEEEQQQDQKLRQQQQQRQARLAIMRPLQPLCAAQPPSSGRGDRRRPRERGRQASTCRH